MRTYSLQWHQVLVVGMVMALLGLPKAWALRYGPASYKNYPAFYNSHPLPTPSFFRGKVLKAVIEVDSAAPARWNYAVAVLSNIEKAFGGDPRRYRLELVAFGPGIRMLSVWNDAHNRMPLERLAAHGLKIRACHNAMLANHLVRKDIFAFARIVPAGVLEVARKEMQGYVALKP
ncbi:MAG: DsrE family protein [Gammaproteobacteria bacterium]|uniref:DsrE family protein n=1 Tax=Acidiferrobacter sp. SPIII_3 TaxID=1281578 RepID=UPI00143CF338|nr:DsrE family protein [Acidiferrobacter sp. SPIII_3]MDA8119915.1 DsrE family protein [Gammaproteobacteria bacterium]